MKKRYIVKQSLTLISLILGLALFFLGGSFSSNTKMERIAEYSTEVVTKHTNSGKLCALTVGSNDENYEILDHESEFNGLYGVFKQRKITFASSINSEKSHQILFKDIDSENLSLFYFGENKTKDYNEHFKHNLYPLELMFPGTGRYIYSVSRYITYLSQSQADALLNNDDTFKDRAGVFLKSDYETLLGQKIQMSIDGNDFDFAIDNIYFEDNYYFEGLKEVMGEFIMTSYYLPNNLMLERKNMYFLSEYSYQNEYFMKYINKAYSQDNYTLKINPYNLKGEIDEPRLLSFFYSKKPNQKNFDWVTVFSFVTGGTLLLLAFILFVTTWRTIGTSQYIVLSLVSFVPYAFFSLLYLFSKNVLLFSEISGRVNAIYIIVFIALLCIDFLTRQIRKNKELVAYETSGKEHYEINL